MKGSKGTPNYGKSPTYDVGGKMPHLADTGGKDGKYPSPTESASGKPGKGSKGKPPGR